MTKQNNIIKEIGYKIIPRKTIKKIRNFFTLAGIFSTGILGLSILKINWLEILKGLVIKLAVTVAFAVIILIVYYAGFKKGIKGDNR